MEIMSKIYEEDRKEGLELFVMMVWSFWYRRNQLVHEGKPSTLAKALEHATSMLKLYQNMQSKPERKTFSPPG